jgi:hypothetical protein
MDWRTIYLNIFYFSPTSDFCSHTHVHVCVSLALPICISLYISVQMEWLLHILVKGKNMKTASS